MLTDFGRKFSARAGLGLTLWLAGAAATGAGDLFAQSVRHTASTRVASPKSVAAGAVPTDTATALMQMASFAHVIFVGHVESVTRNDSAGFVDVRFRIDQPLRGCPTTGVYVLREWAGLWSGHPERYSAGQRLLMLLPARGPSGMSAPVGGMDGAVPIVATGAEPLADGTGVAPADDGSASDPATSLGVDLRWVAAHVARGTVSTSTAQRAVSIDVIGRPVQPFPVDTGGEGWTGPVVPLNPPSAGGSGPAPANLSSVLALLRGTTEANNGAR